VDLDTLPPLPEEPERPEPIEKEEQDISGSQTSIKSSQQKEQLGKRDTALKHLHQLKNGQTNHAHLFAKLCRYTMCHITWGFL